MNLQLQILLPSLALPLLLSVLLLGLSRMSKHFLWALPMIWLPSYFWLIGLPQQWLPQEASQWLWIMMSISTVTGITLVRRSYTVMLTQIILWGISIVLLTWVVLSNQADYIVALELLAVFGVGAVLFWATHTVSLGVPILILAISSGGLAVVTALGGSVLIGQLAGALAATMGAFVIPEIRQQLAPDEILKRINPVVLIYLALLLIARVYAEIPLVSAMMLLAAPLSGLLPGRVGISASVLSVAIALGWLLFTADTSSYY